MSGVLVRVVALMSLMLAQCVAFSAEMKSPEVKEVEQFVKTLYSLPSSKFDFPKKANGHLDHEKLCATLGQFLDNTLIRKKDGWFCELSSRGFVAQFFRYPSATQDDSTDRFDERRPLKYKIESIRAEGNNGVAKVFIPQNDWGADSRIVYFLSKTDKGWRIANLLAYRQWPLDLKGERADCRDQSSHYDFAQPPASEALLEDLPAPCRKMELEEWRRVGKTRW